MLVMLSCFTASQTAQFSQISEELQPRSGSCRRQGDEAHTHDGRAYGYGRCCGGQGYALRCSSARRNSEFFFWRVRSSSTSSLWRRAEVGDVSGGVVIWRKGLRGVA